MGTGTVSDLTFLFCSLGIGSTFAAFVVLIRRRDPGMNAWRSALFAIAAILLGFGVTSLAGRMILGDQAVPAWATLTRNLWMPALGFIYFTNTDIEHQHSMRWIGVLLFLFGALAIAADFHHLTART